MFAASTQDRPAQNHQAAIPFALALVAVKSHRAGCCTEVRGERLNWVCPKIRHAFQTKVPTRNTQTHSLASEGCWRDSSPKARISLAARKKTSRHRSHALYPLYSLELASQIKSIHAPQTALYNISSCAQRHSMLAPSSVASIAMAMLDGRSTGHFLYITCLDNFFLTAREDLATRRPRPLPRPAAEAAKARLICRTSSMGMLTQRTLHWMGALGVG